MKKIISAICLALALVCCFTTTACGKKGKTLTGYDIELSRKVVKYLNETYNTNLSIEFVEIDWDAKETLLNGGSIDLIWNGLTINEERSANMCISIPYLLNKQVVVVKTADVNKYTTIESLDNATIGVESGSAGEDAVVDEDMGKEMITYESQLDALFKLTIGEIDACVIDSVMAGYYSANGKLKGKIATVESIALPEEEYGIAGRKNDKAFISKINEALIALKDTDYKAVNEQFGLTASAIITANSFNPYEDATDNSWNQIVSNKKIVIGYTYFAPIAYTK